jgi:WD40 repeat protein
MLRRLRNFIGLDDSPEHKDEDFSVEEDSPAPKVEPQEIPPGFKLRHTLRGHKEVIRDIAWSPDGKILASTSFDGDVRLWDSITGQLIRTMPNIRTPTLSWAPDGSTLAVTDMGGTVQLRDLGTGQVIHLLKPDVSYPSAHIAWSPKGNLLASSSGSTCLLWNISTGKIVQTFKFTKSFLSYTIPVWHPHGDVLAIANVGQPIQIYDAETGQLLHTFGEHDIGSINITWSRDGQLLASAGLPQIEVWNVATGRKLRTLEGHTGYVNSVSFSYDNRLLASKSPDGTVQLWRCDTWEPVAVLLEKSKAKSLSGALAFHPIAPILATRGGEDTIIRIWELDFNLLLNIPAAVPSVHYTNAKVVLVGDSGVGKSGLGLVLSGEPFAATESTHGRRVWTFDSREVECDNGRKETREILLWDLAGQPGYRLIHQLHLNEVAAALVVFDARSETDPFAGVRHWDRALRQTQRLQGDTAPPLKKLLVAARTDRGGIGVSRERIERLMRDLSFDGYFETSAREGWAIAELADAIRDAIAWDHLPIVSSTELFQTIKEFLIQEKAAGRLLSTAADLYRAFLISGAAPSEVEDLPAQFETCIGRVESRGLIRRLSFGNLILLQPELLDAYASALVNAAKSEPEGLGSIAEEDARTGRFPMSRDERIQDKEQEKLLLIATVEDLLNHEIALREQADDGPHLVFPSQLTRENPDLPDPEGKAVIFGFEGPVLNIYATLAVRLSHSGVFKKQELWKNAATYTAVRGTCGMFLREVEEGRGELTLFFDALASEETRFQFEEYVRTHLKRRALPESLYRRRVFRCDGCGFIVTDQLVRLLAEQHIDRLDCPVCKQPILLIDGEERLSLERAAFISEMDHAADVQRDRETAASILQGKIETGDFDVFLCHNSADKPAVKAIAERLKEQGILPWLDEWELRPGLPWQKALEKQIKRIKSAAVFVGKKGIGPWQDMEVQAFLQQFVKRRAPVIPVLLPDAPKTPKLPPFLQNMTWVDFRSDEPDPLARLIWGITGERDLHHR